MRYMFCCALSITYFESNTIAVCEKLRLDFSFPMLQLQLPQRVVQFAEKRHPQHIQLYAPNPINPTPSEKKPKKTPKKLCNILL